MVNHKNKNVNGFLFVNKPKGPTSHDVVATIRHILKLKNHSLKVGHAGTLDPLAEGLIILGVGSSTKLLSKLIGLDKCYEVSITLGATTITDDAEANPEHTKKITRPREENILKELANHLGSQNQIPPIFSAKKQKGARLYQLARSGRPVEAKPHQITIYKLKLQHYNYPLLKLTVHCSSGTYIRSLARDIGFNLKIGGYVKELKRTNIGPFNIKESHLFKTITKNNIESLLLNPEKIMNRLGKKEGLS